MILTVFVVRQAVVAAHLGECCELSDMWEPGSFTISISAESARIKLLRLSERDWLELGVLLPNIFTCPDTGHFLYTLSLFIVGRVE